MTFCKLLIDEDLQFADVVRSLYAPGVATFGGNLKKLRTAKGLSQEALGRRLGHARPSTVQAWEANRRKPRASAIQEIAKQLDCTPALLLEDVVSDYDSLRGASQTPDIPGPVLTRTEMRALRLLRRMSDEGQKLAVQSIAGFAAAFRRVPSPAQTAQPSHKTAAKGRTGRGRQKAAG